MPLNFPATPTTNDFYQDASATYQWNGVKWRRTDVLASAIVTEYSDIIEQESSSSSIDLEKYNYFKIEFNSNLSISFPTASAHSNIILELNREYVDSSYALGPEGFSVATQDTNPKGMFFKPDGTKMYVVGFTNDSVYEYNLSVAWDVTSAVYLQLFSVFAQETSPLGIFFKPDGTKMYVIGAGGDAVSEYNLSVAWDISSAVYLQNFIVGSQDFTAEGMFFKPDGTKMYMLGSSGDDVNEYNLSVAWDVTSAVYLQLFSVFAQETSPTGMFFKPDGTKMYVTGTSGEDVNEYDLSVAWDVSSASFLQTFDVSNSQENPEAVFFKPDGTKMYIIGSDSDGVTPFDLSVAWDISSTIIASYDNASFSVAAQETRPQAVFFKPDGTKMYVVGHTSDRVHEYDLSVAWDVTSAVFLQNFSVSAQDNTPRDVFFKPDGTKMYIIGSSDDDVNEYNLSVAWDVTSSVYLQNFNIGAQESRVQSVFFKPDGTKMYITGWVGDAVNEYNLSVAWDISSAVFLQLFSVAAQSALPRAAFFKPDGTRMFVIGSSGDKVNEYRLGTAWDVTSAVFVQLFSVAAQETDPRDVFFKPDGTKMYVIGLVNDNVLQYSTGRLSIPVISWSDNILWKDGIAPTLDLPFSTNILINFITYNGADWIGNQLSTNLRSA